MFWWNFHVPTLGKDLCNPLERLHPHPQLWQLNPWQLDCSNGQGRNNWCGDEPTKWIIRYNEKQITHLFSPGGITKFLSYLQLPFWLQLNPNKALQLVDKSRLQSSWIPCQCQNSQQQLWEVVLVLVWKVSQWWGYWSLHHHLLC